MNKKTKQLAIGGAVLAGIAYFVGILTAPKSGKEIRKDIKRASTKARVQAENRLKTLLGELDGNIKEGVKTAKSLNTSARRELQQLIANARVAKVKVRECLSALHEGEETDEELQAAIAEAKKTLTHLKKYFKK
jgi:gas vesicle protein